MFVWGHEGTPGPSFTGPDLDGPLHGDDEDPTVTGMSRVGDPLYGGNDTVDLVILDHRLDLDLLDLNSPTLLVNFNPICSPRPVTLVIVIPWTFIFANASFTH